MDLTGRTVLIVEDDPSVAESNMSCVKATGASVTTTARVSAAVQMVKTRPIEVIVTDFNLTDGDARDLLSLLDKEGIRRNVLVLGAADKSRMEEIGEHHQVGSVLTKPVECSTLQAEISGLLENSGDSPDLSPKLISWEERRRILDEIT